METHGIDCQILSYGNNSPSYLDPKQAVVLCQMANEKLAGYCKQYPGNFYGFAVFTVISAVEYAECEGCGDIEP